MPIANDASELPIRALLTPELNELECAAHVLAVFIVAKSMGAEFKCSVLGDWVHAQGSANQLASDAIVLRKQTVKSGLDHVKRLKTAGVVVKLQIGREHRHQAIEVMRVERSRKAIVQTHDLCVER